MSVERRETPAQRQRRLRRLVDGTLAPGVAAAARAIQQRAEEEAARAAAQQREQAAARGGAEEAARGGAEEAAQRVRALQHAHKQAQPAGGRAQGNATRGPVYDPQDPYQHSAYRALLDLKTGSGFYSKRQ